MKVIHLIFVLLAVFAFSDKALAGSGCIGWYSTNADGEISYYNPATNSYSLLNTFSTANINAGAVEPTTGDVYFVNRATSKLVVYDKTTNTFTTRSGTLPTNMGTVVGATFSNTGTLYVMYDQFRMITVNPATGSQTGSTITYTGVPGDGANPNGTNGDIAFDSTGQMWMVANSSSTNFRLYKLSVSGTTATATAFSPNITGFSGSIAGLVIAPTSGSFFISTANGTYQINQSSGAATLLIADGANDLSGCSVAPDAPTIGKSFSPTSATSAPATSTLTLTIGNTNLTEDYLLTNLVDTLPGGMVVATPNGIGGTCRTVAGNTVTATAGAGTITFASAGKIPIGGCTIIANVTVSAAGTYTNTIAANALKTLAGNNAAAGTAVFTVTLPFPDLTLAKSHTGNFSANSPGTYTLTVTNAGTALTAGAITVTDTLPTGLSVTVGTFTPGGTNGANWSCSSNSASPQVITCTSSNVIGFTSGSNTSVFTLTVSVAANAPSSVTNNASVSGGGEPTANNGNNTASDATTIIFPPNIALVKTCSSPANCESAVQLSGTELTYTISFTNSGGRGATNFSIVDPNPAIATLKLNNDTDFKIGSVTNSLGTTGLTATVTYSNNSGASFTYTPVSAAGGAPAGYDRTVTHIRWAFTGTLSQTAPNNTGNVSFVVRIR